MDVRVSEKWNPKSDLIAREKERKQQKDRMFVCAFRLPRKFKSETDLNSDFQVHLRYKTVISGVWIFFNIRLGFWPFWSQWPWPVTVAHFEAIFTNLVILTIFDQWLVTKTVIARGLDFIGPTFSLFSLVWRKCLAGKARFIPGDLDLN